MIKNDLHPSSDPVGKIMFPWESWGAVAYYGLLALLVLAPLLGSGFILTLDMVFVPHIKFPTEVTSSYAFHTLLALANTLIPSEILQKMLLFIIFLLSGIGAHKLAEYLLPKSHQWPAYVAGTLYIFNPFVYARFMAGQYAVLLGYMLVPFFTKRLLIFLQTPEYKNAIILGLILTGIGVVSIHTLGLVALLAVIAIIAHCWRYRHEARRYFARLAARMAIAIGLFVVLSSYWLVPLTLGQGRTAAQLHSFDSVHYSAFATAGGLLGVLSLQGFWAEAQALFIPPQRVMPGWNIVLMAMLGLVFFGAVALWRSRKIYSAIFGFSCFAAALLALGTTTPVVGVFNQWLVQHLPFFAAYREPQKFVGLLVLGYSVFAAYGAMALVAKTQKWLGKAATYCCVGVLVLLPIAFAPTLLWGGFGQLTPRQYPAGWTAVNQLLNYDPAPFNVLFLPWHQYMSFTFTGRTIANPAPQFFDKLVLVSSDPEFGGLGPQSLSPIMQRLEYQILPSASMRHDLGAHLAPLGIKYIIVSEEAEDEAYAYISKQTDLYLVKQTATLRLYKNEAIH